MEKVPLQRLELFSTLKKEKRTTFLDSANNIPLPAMGFQ
jgi:hypothetical protein